MIGRMFKLAQWKEIISIVIAGLTILGALYFSLSEVWGWPYATEVIATKAAIVVALSSVLAVMSTHELAGRAQEEIELEREDNG